MTISVYDLAHSKGVPAAATKAMLLMQDRITALEAENERLRWENGTRQKRIERQL